MFSNIIEKAPEPLAATLQLGEFSLMGAQWVQISANHPDWQDHEKIQPGPRVFYSPNPLSLQVTGFHFWSSVATEECQTSSTPAAQGHQVCPGRREGSSLGGVSALSPCPSWKPAPNLPASIPLLFLLCCWLRVWTKP